MRIVLLKTLNKKNGLVEGAVRDWPRPTITYMTAQLKEQGITAWFAFDTGEQTRLMKLQERNAARPDLLTAPESLDEQSATEDDGQPGSTAEAILGDQAEGHRAAMAEVPRAQRGPGRPPKTRELEPV